MAARWPGFRIPVAQRRSDAGDKTPAASPEQQWTKIDAIRWSVAAVAADRGPRSVLLLYVRSQDRHISTVQR